MTQSDLDVTPAPSAGAFRAAMRLYVDGHFQGVA